jgi:branched-chain amino acid transport system ATP-binding protein
MWDYKKMRHILLARDIYASYYKKKILYGVTVEVETGEIVALIGPNGAGKSTLLKVIAGVLPAEEGKVFFSDCDVTNISQYELARRGFGYLIQGGKVFRSLTVKKNLELGSLVNEKQNGGRRLEEVLDFFPMLKTILNRRAGLLSGGQKQILAIGIILMNQHPDLFLSLDEPSTGLDPTLVERIMNKILDMREQFGTSILLVEQNIQQALKIADRIYLLKDGKIVLNEKKNSIKINNIDEVFFR